MSANLGRAIVEIGADKSLFEEALSTSKSKALEFISSVESSLKATKLKADVNIETGKALSEVGNLTEKLSEVTTKEHKFSITASLGSAVSSLGALASKIAELPGHAISAAKSAGGAIVSGIEGGVNAAKAAVGGLIDSLGKIGLAANGLKTLAGGFAEVGSGVVKGNAQFETYSVQLNTLIKNSDDFKNATKGVTDAQQLNALASQKTKEEMAKLVQFGATTPFDLPQVVEATTILRGFGLQADNTKNRFGFNAAEIRTIAGDTAAGTGASFNEMSGILGKFSTGATGEAVSRLQELGVTTREELTKMGLHFTKAGELIINSQADQDKATGILMNAMKQKYGGLMDAQSSTLNGMLSNLSDWKDGVIRQVTQPLFEPLKAQLKSFLDFVGSDAGQAAVQKLTDGVQHGVTSIVGFFKRLGPAVKSAWQEFGPLIESAYRIYSAFSPVKTIIDVLIGLFTGGLDGAFNALDQRLVDIGNAIGVDLIDPFHTVFNAVVPGLVEGFRSIADFVTGTLVPSLLDFGQNALAFISPLIQSLADTFTTYLLPALSEFGNFLMSQVVPALGQLAEWVGNNVLPIIGQMVQLFVTQVVPVLAQFAAFILTAVIPALFSIVENIAGVLGPALQAIGTFIGTVVIPAFQNAVNFLIANFVPVIQQVANFFVTTLVPAFQQVADFITSTVLPAIGNLATFFINNVVPAIITVANIAATVLQPILEGIANIITQLVVPAFTTVANFIGQNVIPALTAIANFIGQNVIPALTTVANFITQNVLPVLQTLANYVAGALKEAFSGFISFVKDVWTIFSNAVQTAWNTAQGIFNAISDGLKVLGDAFSALTKVVGEVWANVSSAISNAWNGIQGVFATIGNALVGIENAFIGMYNSVLSVFTNLYNTITGAIGNVLKAISDWGGNVVKTISGFISQAGAAAAAIGKAIIDGIVNAIHDGAGAIASAVGSIVTAPIDMAKNILGIHSPSTVFHDIGQNIVKGLANGIRASDLINESMSQLTNGITDKALQGAIATSETLGKVVANVSSIGENLNKLNNYVGLGKGVVEKFTADTLNLVTSFIGMTTKFKTDMLKGIGEFMDTFGKIASTASSLADIMTKLQNYSAIGLEGMAAFGKDVQALIANFFNISTGFSVEMQVSMSVFSDTVGVVIKVVGDAITVMKDLKGYSEIGLDTMFAFGKDLNALIANFFNITAFFNADMLKSIDLFAQTVGKVIASLAGSVSLLKSLKDYSIIGQNAIFGFGQDIFALVANMFNISTYFDTGMQRATVAFSDTVDKTTKAMASALTVLKGLKDYSVVGENTIFEFGQDIFRLVANFFNVSKYFDADMQKAVTAFSDTVSKVGSSMSSIIGGLKMLVDYVSPGNAAIDAFSANVDQLLTNFLSIALRFKSDALQAVNSFAESVGKVGAILQPALQGLNLLREYSWVSTSNIKDFMNNIFDIVTDFETTARQFDIKTVQAAALFADSIGKMLAIISNGVKALTDLGTYKAVARSNIADFMTNVLETVELLIAGAADFNAKSVQATAVFAEAVNKIFSGLKAAIDVFKGLETFKNVPSTTIQAFINDINLTMTLATQMAQDTNTKLLAQVAAFGSAVGALFTGLKSAMDVFKGLLEFKAVASTTIQTFIDDIVLTVGLAADMANRTNTELLGKAADFASAVDKIFSKFKSALDTFKAIVEFKNIPRDTINQIIDAIRETVARMATANDVANDIFSKSQDFANKMQDAWRNVQRGLEAAHNINNANPSTGGGSSGSNATTGGGSSAAQAVVPGYAIGGIFSSPQIIAVGDGRGPEAVLPIEKLSGIMARALSELSLNNSPALSALSNNPGGVSSPASNGEVYNNNVQTVNNYYQLAVSSNQPSNTIAKDFDLIKAMG